MQNILEKIINDAHEPNTSPLKPNLKPKVNSNEIIPAQVGLMVQEVIVALKKCLTSQTFGLIIQFAISLNRYIELISYLVR